MIHYIDAMARSGPRASLRRYATDAWRSKRFKPILISASPWPPGVHLLQSTSTCKSLVGFKQALIFAPESSGLLTSTWARTKRGACESGHFWYTRTHKDSSAA